MSTDYIPPDDDGKLEWLKNFAFWIQANGTTHGFTPAELGQIQVAADDADLKMAANNAAKMAAKSATADKNTSIRSGIALGRAFAQRLQNHPNTSDADRAAAGLTIPDGTPSGGSSGDILTIPPPILLLDFSVRRQVTIHWGPNPGNEQKNGRPAGTIGCQIQFARGGIPANESSRLVHEIDTESPSFHEVNESAPITMAYRGRYVSNALKFGPYGDPVVCTVSM